MESTKTCTKCLKSTPPHRMKTDKRKISGLGSICKPCDSRKQTLYRSENRESYLETQRLWYRKNTKSHKTKVKNKRSKVEQNVARKRRASRLKTASINPQHLSAFRRLKAPPNHAIDHIIPIGTQGPDAIVCGLNVPWNWQIITTKQNCSKAAWFDNAAYQSWLKDQSTPLLRPEPKPKA